MSQVVGSNRWLSVRSCNCKGDCFGGGEIRAKGELPLYYHHHSISAHSVPRLDCNFSSLDSDSVTPVDVVSSRPGPSRSQNWTLASGVNFGCEAKQGSPRLWIR